MTSTASAMDTLVKSEEMSKLIRISFLSNLMSLIVSAGKVPRVQNMGFSLACQWGNNRGYMLRKLIRWGTYAGDNRSEGYRRLMNLWQAIYPRGLGTCGPKLLVQFRQDLSALL